MTPRNVEVTWLRYLTLGGLQLSQIVSKTARAVSGNPGSTCCTICRNCKHSSLQSSTPSHRWLSFDRLTSSSVKESQGCTQSSHSCTTDA